MTTFATLGTELDDLQTLAGNSAVVGSHPCVFRIRNRSDWLVRWTLEVVGYLRLRGSPITVFDMSGVISFPDSVPVTSGLNV